MDQRNGPIDQFIQSTANRRAYATDARRFVRWCESRGLTAFPASTTTVLLHLATLLETGRKLATIERAIIAISLAQVVAGGENPRHVLEVKEFMKGLRRRLRLQPRREAAPLMIDGLRKAVATQSTSTSGTAQPRLAARGLVWCPATQRARGP